MGSHRKDYKAYKIGKYHNVTSFILFDKYGIDNCKIELVEEVECKTKEELHQREGFYIRSFDCVNKFIAGRTKKEYYQENKEKIKEREKEYREENKEKIKERDKDYYEKNREKVKERHKEYREENKEKLKERKKEYNSQRVTCDICNKEMRKDSLTRHKKLH
jgi:hypothetical protein